MGAWDRKAWKEPNREAGEKAPAGPGLGGTRQLPPPPQEEEADPTLGAGAGAGAFLGRRGVSRADAWSLPRRSSAAATLLPIAAGGGVRRLVRRFAEEVELLRLVKEV